MTTKDAIEKRFKCRGNKLDGYFKKISSTYLHEVVSAMNCLTLKIITLVAAKNLVLCNNDLIKSSVVFSVTSYGRLPGEMVFTVLKDIVGDCLYACMLHLTCLTINYHIPSGRCELVADILYKNNLIQDVGWVSYGHFESERVRYVYSYVVPTDACVLANWNMGSLLRSFY